MLLNKGTKLRDCRGSRTGLCRRNKKLREDLVSGFIGAVSLNIVAKAERRRPLTHKNFAGANISRGAQAAAAGFKGGGLKRQRLFDEAKVCRLHSNALTRTVDAHSPPFAGEG